MREVGLLYGVRPCALALLLFLCEGCGVRAFSDALIPRPSDNATEEGSEADSVLASGDILIVSGGNVARTASPYPLHQIVAYDSEGRFKTPVLSVAGSAMLWGLDLSIDGLSLFFTSDTADYMGRIALSDLSSSIHLLDATNLTGNTMRAMAQLSDGSFVVAEATGSLEKYTAALQRVTTNFPITTVTTITQVHRISGARFLLLGTATANDSPRIYNNNGTLAATLSTGIACGTNCDPADMIELSDGRFVMASQTLDSLELYSSALSYLGRLYQDTSVLVDPSVLAQLANGDLLVCSTGMNVCERLALSGNVATRVGSMPFIQDAGYMRQPTALRVLP